MCQRLDSEQELMTCSTDGVVYAWDCDVVDPVDRIVDPNRIRLNRIVMSPSGKFVAVCGEDHQVKVFDVRAPDHALLAVGLGHSNTVRSIAWSPDEKQLVSVGDDCCICVWNFYVSAYCTRNTRTHTYTYARPEHILPGVHTHTHTANLRHMHCTTHTPAHTTSDAGLSNRPR